MSVRSHTHCSPPRNCSMMPSRVGSASAWKSSAARSRSGVVFVVTALNISSLLDLSSYSFGCPPPALDGNERPHRLDHPEGPGPLGEPIYGCKDAGPGEPQHVPAAAPLERIAHHHRGHGDQPEHRQSIHGVLITHRRAPCKSSSPATPTSSLRSPPMSSVRVSAHGPTSRWPCRPAELLVGCTRAWPPYSGATRSITRRCGSSPSTSSVHPRRLTATSGGRCAPSSCRGPA